MSRTPRLAFLDTDSRPMQLAAVLSVLALAACDSTPPIQSAAAGQVGGAEASATGPAPTAPAPVTATVATAVATELPSRTTSARYEDGAALFREGRYDASQEVFGRYVDAHPDNAMGYYMLGLAAWKHGDLPTAERALDAALTRDPKHAKSYFNSGRVLMDLDRNHEALERVTAGLALDSTSSDGLRLLARAHHRLGQVEAAIDAYRDALVVNEQDLWAMNNLGMLYLEQRDPKGALPPLARAVQLRPTSPIFQNNLGMALELTGYLPEAKAAYDAAVRADSTYRKAVANAERLADVSPRQEGTGADLAGLAELFRQHLRLWKERPAPPTQ